MAPESASRQLLGKSYQQPKRFGMPEEARPGCFLLGLKHLTMLGRDPTSLLEKTKAEPNPPLCGYPRSDPASALAFRGRAARFGFSATVSAVAATLAAFGTAFRRCCPRPKLLASAERLSE